MALVEVHEPEEPLVATCCLAPGPQDLLRRARAVVDARPRSFEPPVDASASRRVVEARLAPRLDRAPAVESRVEPAQLADPEVRAHAGSRRPGSAEDLREQPLAQALDDRLAALRGARGSLPEPRRPGQEAGEHRRV